jgi:hypothetical protein
LFFEAAESSSTKGKKFSDMQKKEKKTAFEIREAALRNKMASNTNSMETLIDNFKAYGQKDLDLDKNRHKTAF